MAAVLFPGAMMRLRIFEPRYLDMVRECGRRGGGFGICLMLQDEAEARAARPAAIGTEAQISDFYTLEDGLLGLSVRGSHRFHVEAARVRDNGLVVATIRDFAESAPIPIRIEHRLLAQLCQRLVDQLEAELDPATRPVTQAVFEDANYVAWRLGELLPLALPDRQRLLELDCAHARLDRLLHLVEQLMAE